MHDKRRICFQIGIRVVSLFTFVLLLDFNWPLFLSLLLVFLHRLIVFMFFLYHFASSISLVYFALSSATLLILRTASFSSSPPTPIESPCTSYTNTQLAQHCTRHSETPRAGAPTLTPLYSVANPDLTSSSPSFLATIAVHVLYSAPFPDDHTFRCHQFTYF